MSNQNNLNSNKEVLKDTPKIKSKFAEREEEILASWKENDIFKKKIVELKYLKVSNVVKIAFPQWLEPHAAFKAECQY